MGKYRHMESKPIDRIIKHKRLFIAAWERVGREQAQANIRELMKETADSYFFNVYADQIEQEKNQEIIKLMFHIFSALCNLKFNKLGEVEKLVEQIDISSSILSIFSFYKLKNRWDEIYSDYCKYVENNPVYLSADELGCLAKSWAIQLNINFNNDNPPYKSYEYYTPSLIRVTLVNHSRNHWQVNLTDEFKNDQLQRLSDKPNFFTSVSPSTISDKLSNSVSSDAPKPAVSK